MRPQRSEALVCPQPSRASVGTELSWSTFVAAHNDGDVAAHNDGDGGNDSRWWARRVCGVSAIVLGLVCLVFVAHGINEDVDKVQDPAKSVYEPDDDDVPPESPDENETVNEGDPAAAETAAAMKEFKAEIKKDLRMVIDDALRVQGVWFLSPLPFLLMFGGISGCLKAPWAKTVNVLNRRILPFVAAMIALVYWMKVTFLNDLIAVTRVYDGQALGPMVGNLTESFVTSVVEEVLKAKKGHSFIWKWEYRNILDAPLELDKLEWNISLTTTQQMRIVTIKLEEPVRAPPSSVGDTVTFPMRVSVDQDSALLSVALAFVAGMRDGLAKVVSDIALTTLLSERGVALEASVTVPLDLKVLPPVKKWAKLLPTINPGPTMMRALGSGFSKMHEEDPPGLLLDPASIRISGYYVFSAYIMVGLIFVVAGSLSSMFWFLLLRCCCSVGAHVDRPPKLLRPEVTEDHQDLQAYEDG